MIDQLKTTEYSSDINGAKALLRNSVGDGFWVIYVFGRLERLRPDCGIANNFGYNIRVIYVLC